MTSLELVRLNIIDSIEPYTFDDQTIESLLSHYNNDINQVSAHIWLIRAGDAAKRNFKFKTEDTEVDKTMTARECREQSAMYRQMARYAPEDGLVEIKWTNAFDPPEGV